LQQAILYSMDSLQDILGKKDFRPPDEIASVKEYIKRRYKSPSTVRVERDVLIVRVPSSALAATLHLEQNRMIEACNINRRLIIRTGR
jgi:hypothetical protein